MSETVKAIRSKHTKTSLNRKILGNTIGSIFLLVSVCCIIMILSMQNLTNNILLDNLQPLARESAKTLEANLHLLADRLISISGDSRLSASGNQGNVEASRQTLLNETKEVYELYTIALYDKNGSLLQGDEVSPKTLDNHFFSVLQETNNLTINETTVFQNQPGITIGMPVFSNGETAFYIVGVYKYEILTDVLNDIHVGQHGQAMIINQQGQIVGTVDEDIPLGTALQQIYGSNCDEVCARMITGETGSEIISKNGVSMFTSFSPIRGTRWALMIEIPKLDYAHLTNRAILTTVLVTGVLLIISILWSIYLSRSISVPVTKMTHRMVDLSNGDLHKIVEKTTSGDELELLSGTLGETVVSLNQYVSEIDRVLSHISNGNLDISLQGEYKGDFSLIRTSLINIISSMNETMGNLRGTTVQLSQMAENLNQQSVQLRESSSEQSHSAGSLVEEVSDVRKRLAQVTNAADQTNNQVEKISLMIQGANSQMNDLSKAMTDIDSDAQEITRIAKTISDVAAQTTLLAVNASIEAARAGGNAGKGFAVVAGEVQTLAAKSAEAAKMATEMANNTKTVVKRGVELTAGAVESVRSIESVSTEISGFTQRLFESVWEQRSALEGMENLIDTIAKIADRNQQSAVESEQSSSVLSMEADKLQNQVHKFVLKGESKR
jgi:methyl-accepting chemotaxis protein